MQIDNVASPEMPGFREFGISPLSIEEILPEILWDH
jgi:NADH dehydrogenase